MSATELPTEEVTKIREGYAFDGALVQLGALLDGEAPDPQTPIGLPLAAMNRHGLISGATGTGKTKTLQVIAEQLAGNGVPVFLADMKGDLSGLATPGESSEGLLKRTASIGQDWQAQGFPVEFFTLGSTVAGQKMPGVPVRASVSSFGPILLSKILGLNATQSSVLSLVFHYADNAGLPMLDLVDLRATVQFLASDDAKDIREELGGMSKATAGVILRSIMGISDTGGDRFFGEPEFEIADFLRTAEDGRGILSILELPDLVSEPELFSTFLMWLLAQLFTDLPEVGDLDKPKLVFFFDEAHLLFRDASKEFLAQVSQTVRLIRSKGVGVFFVTQKPDDVHPEVLSQLGSRVQHALRAHTPDDAKALKAAVSTFPKSRYDLGEVLTTLGTGEAVVTVLDEDGVPTPVARTMVRAPESLMSPSELSILAGVVSASGLTAKYGTPIDRESAHEILAARYGILADLEDAQQAATTAVQPAPEAAAPVPAAPAPPAQPAPAPAAPAEQSAPATPAPEPKYRLPEPTTGTNAPAAPPQPAKEEDFSWAAELDDLETQLELPKVPKKRTARTKATPLPRSLPDTGLDKILSSPAVKDFARTAGREIMRSIFGVGRRR